MALGSKIITQRALAIIYNIYHFNRILNDYFFELCVLHRFCSVDLCDRRPWNCKLFFLDYILHCVGLFIIYSLTPEFRFPSVNE